MVTALYILGWLVIVVLLAADLRARTTSPDPAGTTVRREIPQEPSILGKFFARNAPAPEPPKDYPTASLPRKKLSWRHQMRDLQAEHNTKQKERDALTRPPQSKENSHVRQTR
jgi:hypothetical protein